MDRDRRIGRGRLKAALLGGAAATLLATAAMAQEQAISFDIAAQDAGSALNDFSRQSGLRVLFPFDAVEGKRAPAVRGDMTSREALDTLLKATGLVVAANDGTTVTLTDPQSGSAEGDGADSGTVEALIVTAQKREEDIQDVPIAMSAFTQEGLERAQIAGGPDLMTQVPNMTFTKTNFASYSIQIRGIGTQAISATTDPAVAVAFNNTPFIRNRFFEQEFYDLARVEVLRGPQGTLYGRNATAGVVNIISAKPKFVFEAKARGEVANYNTTRIEGMVNIPLVEDAVALRLAGAWTKRDGYVTNEITGNPIDGRDLWSTRVTLRVAPPDAAFDVNLIWEHFEEDDDRLRSGKQTCKKHRPTSLTSADGTVIPFNLSSGGLGSAAAQFSQGCEAVSLYSPEAFQTPNGFAIPYYQGLQGLGLTLRDLDPRSNFIVNIDPYLSEVQSRDLRVIESVADPDYRAKSDVFELQANVDITEGLTLTSETSYSTDELFALQDLNRFNTAPGVFGNSTTERGNLPDRNILNPGPNGGGIFCDPQIGCSDRLVVLDLSTADSVQFSQELRLGSDFDGPFNFSLGANYLRYDTTDKYYVFINTIALTALNNPFMGGSQPSEYVPNVTDNRECVQGQGLFLPPDPSGAIGVDGCLYIDPNPIGSLNDKGHNYFLSKNPYKLISYALFGEAYYNLSDDLKVTAGLRWTVDQKEAPRIPSMLLAVNNNSGDPTRQIMRSSTIGLVVDYVSEQEWREPTGRLAIDWKPDLAFTDETLLYASYAHGYKAGGANPPPTAIITYGAVAADGRLDNFAIFPRTFEPEFIDAFELGAKNTLLDGTLTLNTAAFYYDYKNYQVSEIVERSALNRNFDATVWGVELEADWRPLENLKLSFKGGYEKTRIADGEQAIDLMDRTAGDPNYTVIRPFPASPSNCVVPTWLLTWNNQIFDGADDWGICTPIINGFDPVTWLPYVPNPTLRSGAGGGTPISLFAPFSGNTIPANYFIGYPGYDPATNNNSTGIYKDLGGNELPNAPQFTVSVSADYTIPLQDAWTLSLHSDVHWQAESWWRVFNDLDYNRLDSFYTLNLAAIIANDELGWNIMAYVKNATDVDAITGAFLFSDDLGLPTNVFLNEPRLYGLRVTKEWSGGSLLGSFGQRHEGAYPFEVELGGQVQRHDAPYDPISPDFFDDFSDAIDPTDTQNQDLDWGDGRSVKLTYRPTETWYATAGVRIGKTNGSAADLEHELGEYACRANVTDCGTNLSRARLYATLYSEADVTHKEEHTIIDFAVGREVGREVGGLGGVLSRAGLSAGLRHASLNSRTATHTLGIPYWDMPLREYLVWDIFDTNNSVFFAGTHDAYDATITADREFEGVGPVVSFEGSRTVWGDDALGRLDIDASVTGGALFGDQTTNVTGSIKDDFFDNYIGVGLTTGYNQPDVRTITPVNFQRSESVTVPLLDVSLGLSYEIDRVKIGAGYRWERYFEAIDGGYDEAESQNRTIDGPYFKLSVGFGG